MFRTISMKQLEEMLERQENGRHTNDFVLLDVRSREEYAKGHLRGAWNFPYEEMEYADGRRSCIIGLPRGTPVIVYCDYGSHSMQAARILERLGYQVINTAGGLSYYRGRHMVRGA